MVSTTPRSPKRRLVFLLLCTGIFLLLLGGTQIHEGTGERTASSSSSFESTFPIQIKLELIQIEPTKVTIVVGQWNQTNGSNKSLAAQIGVNEANQTFWITSLEDLSLEEALAYNLTFLTLVVTDANGTGYIQMINPGTIAITSSDKWSYSPLGTDTGYLYVGEYFMIQPGSYSTGFFSLPNNPFPPFPTITYHILIFHITVPDILAIPQWIGEIVVWAFNELVIIIAIGWEDVIEVPVKYIGHGITYIADLYDGIWTDIYNVVAPLPDGLGIFALPVASMAFGALLFITVAGFALIGEGIVKLVSG
jgi:hypothetical protein